MVDIPPQLIGDLTVDPTPVLAGHVTPDADCLGSMFALALGLSQVGNGPIRCALPAGSVSRKLAFLVELAGVPIADASQCAESAVLVVCDTAKARRTNLPGSLNHQLNDGRRVINIDHHASNTRFGDVNYVDESASSTAELIYRIFKQAHWQITPVIATLIYAGLHGDTVGFSLPSAGVRAFEAAAEVVSCGADVSQVGDRLWRQQERSEFELRRMVYDNTRLSTSGRIAYSSVTFRDLAGAGCSAADIDDQVEIPRALAGTHVAILFSEGQQGKVRVNLRSKTGVSVLELAQQVGGGGHRLAAGAIMNGTVEESIEQLIPLAERFLDDHNAG